MNELPVAMLASALAAALAAAVLAWRRRGASPGGVRLMLAGGAGAGGAALVLQSLFGSG